MSDTVFSISASFIYFFFFLVAWHVGSRSLTRDGTHFPRHTEFIYNRCRHCSCLLNSITSVISGLASMN